MNQEKFIQAIEDSNKVGVEIIRKKNNDYAGKQDPFKNFKLFEFVMKGIDLSKCDPTELSQLVRILDKVQRISNLLSKPADVVDESMEDTLIDLANYSHILLAYRKSIKDNKRMYATKKTATRDSDN